MSNHIFAYAVTDKPNVWLTIIAPDATLEDVHATLLAQFGDRLLGVREHAGDADHAVPADPADLSADIDAESAA
jgi:hypothetical protein